MSPKSKLSWSDNYSEFLKTLVYDEKNNKLGKLLDVKPYCGTNSIKFEIVFKPGELQKMIKRSSDGKDEIEKYLKLAYKISSTNMWLHNSDGVITYYENATDILNYFYDFRLKMYRKRKENRLKILLNELNIIKYKVKFINEKINGDILLDNQSMKKLKEQLVGRKYPMLSLNLTAIDPPSNYTDEDDNVNDDNALIKTVKIVYKSHKYITDMKITSLTTDKIEELENKLKEKQREYDDYFNTTEEELWRRELTALLEFYNNWMDARIREDSDSDDNDTNKKSKSKASKSKKEDVPKKKKSKK
jgi:DNA topoisomerase-2